MKIYHSLVTLLAFILCSNLLAQAPLIERSSSVSQASSVPADSANTDLSSPDNQYYQLQVLQQEVRALRGLVEELNYQLQQNKQQQMDDYLDLDRRLSELAESNPVNDKVAVGSDMLASQGAQSNTANNIVDGQVVTSDAVQSPQLVDEATMKADYDRAVGLLLQNRDLDGAIVAFQNHIDKYPNSAFIPNAYYWLGEIYDLRDQKDLALQSFRIVVDIYTDHNKAMDARFKLGKLYHKLGQDQVAKQLLEAAAQSNGGASAKARAYLENNPL